MTKRLGALFLLVAGLLALGAIGKGMHIPLLTFAGLIATGACALLWLSRTQGSAVEAFVDAFIGLIVLVSAVLVPGLPSDAKRVVLILAAVIILPLLALRWARKNRDILEPQKPGSWHGTLPVRTSTGSMAAFIVVFLFFSQLDVDEMFISAFGQHGKMIYWGVLLSIICLPFLLRGRNRSG